MCVVVNRDLISVAFASTKIMSSWILPALNSNSESKSYIGTTRTKIGYFLRVGIEFYSRYVQSLLATGIYRYPRRLRDNEVL